MFTKQPLRMPKTAMFGVVLAAVSACAELPEYASLDRPLPVSFGQADGAVMPRQVDVIWWRHLNDPIINQLVQQVYNENLTISIAALRVTEAEALRRAVGSGLSVTGDASASVQRDFDAGSSEQGEAASLGLNWLLDPYGRLAAGRALAENDITIAKAELASARQVVVANLLNTYIDLRFQQNQRENLLSEINRRRTTISQQENRAAAGAVTEIELNNARAQLAATRSELPQTEAEIQVLKDQIAVLAGVVPGELDIDLDARRPQPVPVEVPEAGLPTDLMRNRADLFILERNYYAALLSVTQARADLYPSLSVGGTLSVNTLGDQSETGVLSARVTLPALPNGPVRGQVDAAEVRVEVAFEEWSQAVLAAAASAQAALLRTNANAEALRAADQNVALSRRSLDLTKQVVGFNGATLDEVTNAEDRLSAALDRRSRLRQAYARAYVTLQVELGSGEVLALQTQSRPPSSLQRPTCQPLQFIRKRRIAGSANLAVRRHLFRSCHPTSASLALILRLPMNRTGSTCCSNPWNRRLCPTFRLTQRQQRLLPALLQQRPVTPLRHHHHPVCWRRFWFLFLVLLRAARM